MNLTISPVDGLVVVVPRGFDERLIPGLLDEQRSWIDARLKRIGRIPDINPGWQRPASVSLPAANERWSIDYRANGSATVRITTRDDAILCATGAVENEAQLRAALLRWLKRRAQYLLTPWTTELAARHDFNISRITIRHQRSRWGSCSSRGTISLNAKLMFLPSNLVNHVLLHELCHTIHPHHGPAFYELLASLEPDHRQQRAALRETWANIPDWALR